MDVDKEIEILKLKIRELELRKEIEKYKKENENIIKIPEIIRIPIIIPECPPKPCPKKQPIYPKPVYPWESPTFRPYPNPDETVVICGSVSCDSSKVNFKEY